MERSLSRSKASRSLATSPTSGGGRATSPRLRRPASDALRNIGRTTADDDGGSRGPWPSASKKSDTLSDCLGNDRLIDLQERRNGHASARSRHRTSSSEFGRSPSKENRPVGGFARSTEKSSHLSRSSGKHDAPASPSHAAVRMPIDADIPSKESEPRGPPVPRGHQQRAELAGDRMHGRTHPFRSSATSQWALSPGRSALDGGGSRSFSKQRPALDGCGSRSFTSQLRAAVEGGGSRPSSNQRAALDGGGSRSFSSLRPGSPGNLVSGLGMDVFRKRAPSPCAGGGASPLASVSLVAGPPASGSAAVGEIGHQFRLVHNRVIQWLYVNARSQAVNHVRWLHAKDTLLSAWTGLLKLQILVVHKRMHLERKKLVFKVNKIISQQMKALGEWGLIESKHSTALSTTSDCLQSAVCKVPLIQGAKGDPQAISVELRRAVDLAATVTMTVNTFLPTAKETGPLLVELAQVVTREKSLLEECFELMRIVSTLHLQEQSLKCHKVQLKQHANQWTALRTGK